MIELIKEDERGYLQQFDRLLIGFSGGLDSTVLLHALSQFPELKPKLLAVHVNHGLSQQASVWQAHCRVICDQEGIAYEARAIQIAQNANIEEAAREARYAVFHEILTARDVLVLAHHQDDQAETLLLHLCRGAGVQGLAAMQFEQACGLGRLFRPLLALSRAALFNYATQASLRWVDDESNEEIRFSRNFLRKQIMPLLQQKWPAVSANLARTAQHCQDSLQLLEDLALQDADQSLDINSLQLSASLCNLSRERLINVLRCWIKRNHFLPPSTIMMQQIVEQVIHAKPDSNPLISWNNQYLRRYRNSLYLLCEEAEKLTAKRWTDFPNPLPLGYLGNLHAQEKEEGLQIPYNAQIEVRFREGGEVFQWHGQKKSLKKLWQEWGVPTWLRHQIPLVYINGELAAVVGYAISDRFYARPGFSLLPLGLWR